MKLGSERERISICEMCIKVFLCWIVVLLKEDMLNIEEKGRVVFLGDFRGRNG